VVLGPAGQLVAPVPVTVVLPNGQRVLLGATPPAPGAPPPRPVDDLIRLPAAPPGTGQPTAGTALVPGSPGTRAAGLLPPPGTRFDPSLAGQVARIPLFVRGAFKVTENGTPRPTTRTFFSYYFYDQVFQSFGGPNVPRMMLHQQVFGHEQAFLDDQYSVELRVPYIQFVSPGFYSDTGIGDVTVIGKAVLLEDRATGNLWSAGLGVTVPTGKMPFSSTITGQSVRGSLIQPWTGYIVSLGDWFSQGFYSLVVPTDSADVTFVSSDVALGYFLYRSPGSALTAVVPVLESHLNVPLNHRGTQVEPVGFVTQLTLLAGAQFFLGESARVGFAVGAPVTGPRPFSLQASLQLNWRY
jgi:hypothetical protein